MTVVPPISSYSLAHGCLHALPNDPSLTVVHGWDRKCLRLDEDATHFGFVLGGPAGLRCASGNFTLCSHLYFAAPGTLEIEHGCGFIVSRAGHAGFFHLGGPIESRGRLRYIDGCTDSLLVPPVVRGDPCLNLLHLPPGTRQTMHTHPSPRVGLVVRGVGMCVTAEGNTPLYPGTVFVIRANGPHCFHTDASEMLIVAYHPDSDFGPTDEVHPMINRTILPGDTA